jgi:peptidoglycan/xylan/chitin deacetylase (PgdA/CDA1 family)
MTSNFKFILKHSVATTLSTFKKREVHHNVSLMYHSLFKGAFQSADLYSLRLDKFKKQMNFLKFQKDSIIPFEASNSGVSVTFDDGHLDNYELAAPYLLEQNIPFTIFMISDFISPHHKGYMNKEHLRELAVNSLVTIGSHGKSHQPLAKLPLDKAVLELSQSKKELEDIIGKEVTTMSFPHGSFSEELLLAAKEMGYKKCGTSIERTNTFSLDQIQVNRVCIYSCDSMLSFKQKLNGQWDWVSRR